MARLFIFLPIGIIAVSTASIFIKLCDAPAIVIAAYRMVFASLLLLPFAGYRRVWSGWERKDLGWLLLSGMFLGAHFASWIASLKFTSVASSVVLVSTHPIFVGIGSRIMLKEPLGVKLIAGIALTVFGIDKLNSRKGGWRIPESRLLLIAVFGPFGAYSGMLLFRHKTRKIKFLLVPVFLFIQVILIIYLFI